VDGASHRSYRLQHLQTLRLKYTLRNGYTPTLDEFRQILRRRPLTCLNQERVYRHRYYFRSAASNLFNNRRVSGSVYLSLSMVFAPFLTMKRIREALSTT
jgi:hypothetical protein